MTPEPMTHGSMNGRPDDSEAYRLKQAYLLLQGAMKSVVDGVVPYGPHPGHVASKSEMQRMAKRALQEAEEILSKRVVNMPSLPLNTETGNNGGT